MMKIRYRTPGYYDRRQYVQNYHGNQIEEGDYLPHYGNGYDRRSRHGRGTVYEETKYADIDNYNGRPSLENRRGP